MNERSFHLSSTATVATAPSDNTLFDMMMVRFSTSSSLLVLCLVVCDATAMMIPRRRALLTAITTTTTTTTTRHKQRKLQQPDACTEENEWLATAAAESLGNMNAEDPYDNGLFFLFGDPQDEGRVDFDKYFTCNVDDNWCDYTVLRDKMTPLCEFFGGQMYSVDGVSNCTWVDADYYTETIADINFPMCLGPSCDTQPWLDQFTNDDECTAITEYTAKPVPFYTSDQCRQETKALFSLGVDELQAELGLGSGSYVFADGVYDFDLYCTENMTDVRTEECDFEDLLGQVQDLCQDAGGFLYSYDDLYTEMINGTETSREVFVYSNMPICVGTSCNAEIFFTQVLFPAFEYSLTAEMNVFDAENNVTTLAISTYTALDYRAISTAAPNTSPTDMPSRVTISTPPPQPTPRFTPRPTPRPTPSPASAAGLKHQVHPASLVAFVSLVIAMTVG